MTQVIDIQHWLDERGQPAAPVRRRALRVARLIEYGGPLPIGYARETLVECSRRVGRRACEGLLWVKIDGFTIEAYCRVCRRDHLVISEWLTRPRSADPLRGHAGAAGEFGAAVCAAVGVVWILVRQLRGPHLRTCA